MDGYKAREEEYRSLQETQSSQPTFTSVIEQIVENLPANTEQEPPKEPVPKPKEVFLCVGTEN